MVFGSRPLGWLTFQVQGLGFASCYHLNLLVVVAKWYFPCMLVLGFIRLQINSDQGIYSTGCSSSVVIFGLLIFLNKYLKNIFHLFTCAWTGLYAVAWGYQRVLNALKLAAVPCLMWVLDPKSISSARVEHPSNTEPPLQPLTQIISRVYNI